MRPLTLKDLEPYVAHLAAHHAESGRDGDPYSGPYSRDEPFPTDESRQRTRTRWTTELNAPAWRRAWGAFDGDAIIASANVAGGTLPADLHRVNLGISVLRRHRRRGIGQGLIDEIIGWCQAQPLIDWIDLGVFGENVPAQRLFQKVGFQVIGRTDDRWRVDGHAIDEILMTLRVV